MAEVLMLACDRCGRPAVESVSLRVSDRSLVTDLCQMHLDELIKGARTPKRGRKPATLARVTPPKRRGRPPGSKNKATTSRKTKAAKTTKRKRAVAKR
jgi:hypothetical protein